LIKTNRNYVTVNEEAVVRNTRGSSNNVEGAIRGEGVNLGGIVR
jgi:hypothetical protein